MDSSSQSVIFGQNDAKTKAAILQTLKNRRF